MLDLPWVVVATPLLLFATLSVFASISGIIVRRVTDDRRSQEKAVVYLIQKRSELLVSLDTKFDAAMMEKLNSVGTHLGQAMVRLLESAEKEEDRNFSDIKFEIENKLIYAHRSVLHLRRQMWNCLSDLENGESDWSRSPWRGESNTCCRHHPIRVRSIQPLVLREEHLVR